MQEKKKFQGNYYTSEKVPWKNFPGWITLIITILTYLFINLFYFKFLVANEFFPNF